MARLCIGGIWMRDERDEKVLALLQQLTPEQKKVVILKLEKEVQEYNKKT